MPLTPTGRRDGTLRGLVLAIPVVLVLTGLVTWPTALTMAHAFQQHVDAYFSTWRLMWIAHALRTDPDHLFDANIFYPSTGTLAYSDATMLQGALAAPFIWAGVSPVLMYNLLLLVGFAGSGIGMFVLARHVTERTGPALVAAAVFMMATYRIEHVMHLEMQWAMWIPLAFWSLTRTVEEKSWRFGALSGIFLWLQVMSCVYYGIFLAVAVLILVPVVMVRASDRGLGALGPLVLAGALGFVLTIPYAMPYIENARTLGARPPSDILPLSATPMNYLAAVDLNWLWGWTSERFGASERRLFPGLVALVLSCAAGLGYARRDLWPYLAVALVSIELSFGLNGWLYSWLFDHVPAFRGLRSPARFAIVAQCALAMLAALGARALEARYARSGSRRAPAVWYGILVLLIAAESANRPMHLARVRPPNRAAYDVYRAIRSQGPGVVLELPVPDLEALPGYDGIYAYWSAAHWNKLVNGYSGYYPQVYTETLNVMRHFPDEESLSRLQRMDVRYIVVHREFFQTERYNALLLAMVAEPRLKPFGEFKSPSGGETRLFLLQPSGRPPSADVSQR